MSDRLAYAESAGDMMEREELVKRLENYRTRYDVTLHKVEICNVAYMNAVMEAVIKTGTADQAKAARAFIDEEGRIPHKDMDFVGDDLSGMDLQGLDFRGANFTDAKLAGADLRGANLGFCNFSKADLQGADLRGANLSFANFSDVLFSSGTAESQAQLASAVFIGTFLWRANLSGCDLRETIFMDADFRNANMTAIRAQGAWLRRNIMAGAWMPQADLRNSRSFSVDFTGANLTEANLEGADLRGSTLTGATLTNANFKDANIADAVFAHAVLTGTQLENKN